MYSKAQLHAMKMIEALGERFNPDRWFTQAELPGVTRKTMQALVNKGYLRWMGSAPDMDVGDSITYYQIIPPLERRI